MSRESVEKDLLTEKKQMFFKNQIIKLDKLIDILIEFRMDIQIYDKNKGKYCTALPNSKRWKLFWDEE